MMWIAKITSVLGILVLYGSAWAVDSNGLVAHWKFDEGSGDTAYDSAGDNHGTIYGAQWTEGKFNSALEFDGIDDFVDLGNDNSLKPPLPITISAWIRLNSLGMTHKIVSLDDQSYTYCGVSLCVLKTNNKLSAGFGDGNGWGSQKYRRSKDGTTVLSTNVWYHVVGIIRDATDMDLYINGQNDGGVYNGSGGDLAYLTGNSRIGSGNYGEPDNLMDGKIDDARVYDRALSSEEVQQLYEEGLRNLVGLEIVGPNEVAEEFQAQYTAIAHYDNNSTTVDVTDLAVWSVEPNDIANIDAGLLETGEIDKPQDITIYAQYSEDNNTIEAEKEVTIFSVCPSGYALDFDGDDYVNVGNDSSLKPPLPITISAWIRLNSLGKYQFIASLDDLTYTYCGAWLTVLKATNRLSVGFGDGNGWGSQKYRRSKDGTTVLSKDAWYHVVGVIRSATEMDLYINGQDDGGVYNGSGGDLAYLTGNSRIGAGNDGEPDTLMDGKIDDVRVYDRALSAEEIYASMHTRPSGDEPNLVASWGFDEGEGQVAYDLSPYSNDGILGSTSGVDDSDPEWVESDAPIGICYHVNVDIKPGSCPNPLNLISQGILPVAVVGTDDFDVNMIDGISVSLAGVSAIRGGFEDVATPIVDGNECDCTEEGPDGYTDLTLKFRNQEVVEQLMKTEGELAKDQVLNLTLRAVLSDGMVVEGSDCVKLVGNVPKWLATKMVDVNADGVIDFHDYAMLAKQWLESY